MSNTIELSGIFSEGYGFVPKKLMKAKDIKATTKLLLCYLLSYTGSGIECFPSMQGIADNLNMSKRTIVRCINDAIRNGYLNKKQGQLSDKRANKYYLLFMNDLSDKKSPTLKQGDKRTKQGDKNDTNKVTPGNSNSNSIKSNNKNNNYEIPSSLKAFKEFDNVWKEWIIFRSEIKKKLTPSTAKKQFEMLSKQPDPVSVINKSIECGWQGLFPLKDSSIQKKETLNFREF